MNFHGPPMGPAGPGSDENDAPLREAVLAAQAQESRATNHVAKGPTRGGRRVMIVKGDANQHALQYVVR